MAKYVQAEDYDLIFRSVPFYTSEPGPDDKPMLFVFNGFDPVLEANWIVARHRPDGQLFIVYADEIWTD